METSMRVVHVIVLSILALVSSHTAFAQNDRRWAVGGAAIYSTQGAQSAGQLVNNPSIPEPPIGGSAAGFVASAEFRLGSVLGLGVEVSDTARFEGVQTRFRQLSANVAATEFDKRHRDLIVSALFHAHQRVISRVAVDATAGPSFVLEDTSVRTATAPPAPTAPNGLGPFGPFGSDSSLLRGTVGLTAGVDVTIEVSHHISIGPTFRAHYISRESLAEGNYLGLDSTVLRFGAGVRVNF